MPVLTFPNVTESVLEGKLWNRVWLRFLEKLTFSPGVRMAYGGTGDPNGAVTAPPGSFYLNTSGGVNATLWIKESGTGNTGWIAK
jgi:hypothetical protein